MEEEDVRTGRGRKGRRGEEGQQDQGKEECEDRWKAAHDAHVQEHATTMPQRPRARADQARGGRLDAPTRKILYGRDECNYDECSARYRTRADEEALKAAREKRPAALKILEHLSERKDSLPQDLLDRDYLVEEAI